MMTRKEELSPADIEGFYKTFHPYLRALYAEKVYFYVGKSFDPIYSPEEIIEKLNAIPMAFFIYLCERPIEGSPHYNFIFAVGSLIGDNPQLDWVVEKVIYEWTCPYFKNIEFKPLKNIEEILQAFGDVVKGHDFKNHHYAHYNRYSFNPESELDNGNFTEIYDNNLYLIAAREYQYYNSFKHIRHYQKLFKPSLIDLIIILFNAYLIFNKSPICDDYIYHSDRDYRWSGSANHIWTPLMDYLVDNAEKIFKSVIDIYAPVLYHLSIPDLVYNGDKIFEFLKKNSGYIEKFNGEIDWDLIEYKDGFYRLDFPIFEEKQKEGFPPYNYQEPTMVERCFLIPYRKYSFYYSEKPRKWLDFLKKAFKNDEAEAADFCADLGRFFSSQVIEGNSIYLFEPPSFVITLLKEARDNENLIFLTGPRKDIKKLLERGPYIFIVSYILSDFPPECLNSYDFFHWYNDDFNSEDIASAIVYCNKLCYKKYGPYKKYTPKKYGPPKK